MKLNKDNITVTNCMTLAKTLGFKYEYIKVICSRAEFAKFSFGKWSNFIITEQFIKLLHKFLLAKQSPRLRLSPLIRTNMDNGLEVLEQYIGKDNEKFIKKGKNRAFQEP